MHEEDNGYFRGLVTGLLFGAAAALLLAPRSGGELRGGIAEGAGKVKDRAGEWGGGVAGTISEKAHGVVESAHHLAENVVEKAHHLKERGEDLAETATIAAMVKADEVRDAIAHRGEGNSDESAAESSDDALADTLDDAEEVADEIKQNGNNA